MKDIFVSIRNPETIGQLDNELVSGIIVAARRFSSGIDETDPLFAASC